jgi:hypothetical protein
MKENKLPEQKVVRHTRGPWTISETFDALDGEEDISIEHEGFPLCTVRGTNDYSCIEPEEFDEKDLNGEVIANAKLIAAAPDLLEACMMLLKEYEDVKMDTPIAYFKVISKAEDAIKKAT